MDNRKRRQFRRLMTLGAISITCGLVCAANLFSLEIIHGDENAERANQQLSYTRTITASRGEILDRNGQTLISNTTMYAIVIDYAAWDREKQNDVILRVSDMVHDDISAQLNDSLPIKWSNDKFQFSEGENSRNYKKLVSFCKEREWDTNLSADAIMNKLCEYYEISTAKYSQAEQIKIARVRYQMSREQFSIYNPYTLATEISIDLVTKVMEQHDTLPGVEVETKSERQIDTTIAGNILGYTGPIYEEDWDEYSEQGYSIDSIVGKTGVEEAFEKYLHGKDGQRTIQTDANGNILGETVDREAESGKSVRLTIDSGLQKLAEESLASRCESIEGAEGGAAVVIDVNNGEILAMANYPTYNPQQFREKYDELSKDPLSPLINRCIASTYAPGSTYKLCTAVAGLEEGVIDANTQIFDEGIYTYYEDYQPKCWYYTANNTGHGYENVVQAIEDSCNYFFFETGRRVGGEKLEKYAKQFGLGEYTGVELTGEQTGTVSGPTERAKAVEKGLADEWTGGDVLQSAIGQGDNEFTPVQLANYCAAIANGGKVYSAHLLKEVVNYDNTKTLEEIEPEVISEIEASDTTWNLVREGMSEVTSEDGTAAEIFDGYSIKVAGKSGTAQRGEGKQDNGLFVSYAPYDDPQIAVCVVIEGGDSGNNVAPVVLDIYNHYFYGSNDIYQEPVYDEYQYEDYTEEETEEEQAEDGNAFTDWISGLFGA